MKSRIVGARTVTIAVALMAISSLGVVQAEEVRTGYHFSGLFLNANEEVDDSKEDRGSLAIKIGKAIDEDLSWEAHASRVNNSDEDNGIFTVGGFLRYDWRFEKYSLYGLGGVSSLYNYVDEGDDINESSVSFGFGIDLFGSPNLAMTFEYVYMINAELDDGEDLTYQTIGLGLTYFFTTDDNRFNKNQGTLKNIRYN